MIVVVIVIPALIFFCYRLIMGIGYTYRAQETLGQEYSERSVAVLEEKGNRARSIVSKLQLDTRLMSFLLNVASGEEVADRLETEYYNYFIPTLINSIIYADETLVNITFWYATSFSEILPEYQNIVRDERRIGDVDWVAQFKESDLEFRFVPAHDYNLFEMQFGRNKEVFSFVQKIKMEDNYLGMLCVDIGVDEVLMELRDRIPQDKIALLSDGKILAGDELPIEEGKDFWKSGNYFFSCSQECVLGCSILTVGYSESISRELLDIFFLLMILVCCGVAVYLLIRVQVRRFFVDMHNVFGEIDAVVQSGFRKEVQFAPSDTTEMQKLEELADDLLMRIRELLERQVQFAVAEKDAQLKALRYQINPHFIYNMLESFRMRAYLTDKQLASTIAAFGRILRENISDPREITELKDELLFVEKYAMLYNFRFADAFALECDVSQELEKCNILRFLLQPIVENCFVHARRKNGEKVHVKISARREGDKILIIVADNGGGISQDVLDEVNAGKHTGNGLGLVNIADRIRLFYGEDCGLFVTSSEDGTIVTLFLREIDV